MNYWVDCEDIRQWIKRFQSVKQEAQELKEIYPRNEYYKDIIYAMNDALYLVALVESQLKFEEPDGVIDRAMELRGEDL